MKHIARCVVILVVSFLWCSETWSATVVWPASWIGPLGPGEYLIGSNASPDGGVAFQMLLLDGSGYSTLTAQNGSTGIGYIWYETSAGTPINANSVAGAQPFCNAFTGAYGSMDVTIDQTLYLGFFIERPFSGGAVYGWASLVYDGTTLSLLDSAAETTGVGIYAGTYTAIPEPCTSGLALTGVAVMAIRRRLRQHR